MRFRGSGFCLLAALVSGCATYEVPRADFQPFNSAAHGTIQRIGVLTPGVDERLQVRVVNPAADNLPLLGPLISEGVAAARASEFSGLAREQGFDKRNVLASALVRALNAQGFDARLIPTERGAGRFLSRYPREAGVDASLDSFGTHSGYFAAGATTPYRPTVFLGVRLVRASDQRVLFSESLVHNPIGDTGDAITLQAPDEAAFANFNELTADPAAAVAALEAAYRSLAEQIGHLLK